VFHYKEETDTEAKHMSM